MQRHGDTNGESEDETDAYKRLSSALMTGEEGLTIQVTGRLHKRDTGGYPLEVRSWSAKDVGAVSSKSYSESECWKTGNVS